jgi:CcmD family protein
MPFLKRFPTPLVSVLGPSFGSGIVRLALVCVLLCLGVSTDARGQQPPPRAAPPAAQDEYVPISEVPQDEQLPAVPLVFIAYGLIWLAVLVYVLTIWRRQTAVQKEIDVLKRQLRG